MKYLFSLLLMFGGLAAHAQIVGGIGAQLQLDTAKEGFTLPRIKGVVPYSPADSKNIPLNSYILRVNEFDCRNKPLEEVVTHIRGEVGAPLTLLLADNPQGKKAKEYSLVRGTIVAPPVAAAPPPPDPTAAFETWCTQQLAALRKQGHTIVKKFNSDCGNYFFNFECEALAYHARLCVLEEKGAAGTLGAAATLFDNSDEAAATPLKATGTQDLGTSTIAIMEATATLKRNSVGVVSVKLAPPPAAGACKAMFIVVYK